MRLYYRLFFILAVVTISLTGNATNIFASKNFNQSEDSVKSWGPWEKMVSPAAGSPAPPPVSSISLYTPASHRPDINATQQELSCPSGGLCGYGILKVLHSDSLENEYSRLGYHAPSTHVATFEITPESDSTIADWHPNNFTAPNNAISGSYQQGLSFNGSQNGARFLNSLTVGGTLFSDWQDDPRNEDSGPFFFPAPNTLFSMTGQNMQDGQITQFTPKSMNDLVAATRTGTGTMPGFLSDASTFAPFKLTDYYSFNAVDNGVVLNPTRDGQLKISFDSQAIISKFGRDLGVYLINIYSFDRTQWTIQNVREYIAGSSQKISQSNNVVGVPTTINQLETASTLGNIQATYTGYSFNQSGSSQAQVTVDVDFASGSWAGSWNGGKDGYVIKTPIVDPNIIDANGNFQRIGTIIDGEIGFNATGTINGNTITSTAISANDGIVQGSVNGAFFNAAGDVLAGVADIVKTSFDSRYENAQHVSTFVTAKRILSSGQ